VIMMRTRDARARDVETKKIEDNITNVEKYFGNMCQHFAAYARKTARLRDKGDILVRLIGEYADTETPDLKSGMKEAKVVKPLKQYSAVVRRQREDLKSTQNARDREVKQTAQLERTRQKNPSDRQIIAETELQRATNEATRSTKCLEESIDRFESQKIVDLKKIFGEFVIIEMAFHAKALEMYTKAYDNIQQVDEDKNLEEFRSSLYRPERKSHLVRAHSLTSLNRTESPWVSQGRYR
uniref:Family with sequence similarity 92 member A1 n=1 Tax=Neogobius melanostomus TaxID=47308 RepID=A0A8C6TJE3_9GOBI